MDAPAELSARLIGSIFVEKGLITQEQLDAALKLQQETGERLGEIVVGEFGVPRLELASVLAEQWAAYERAEPTDEPSAPGASAPAMPTPADTIPPVSGEPLLRRPIGEIFVERGFVSDDQLKAAVELQRKTGQRLGEVLVEQGALSRLDLASALAEQWANLQKIRPPTASQQATGAAAQAASPSPSPHAASDEAVASLSARIAELERASVTLVAQPQLDALLGELRAALAALEHRLSESVAHDEERAMAAIVSKIDAMRSLVEEPLHRIEELERRIPDAPSLDELDARYRSALDDLGARLDAVTDRSAPTSDAFDALRARVEELGASLAEREAPAPTPELTDKLDAVAGQVEAAQTGLASLASRLEELGAVSQRIDEVASQLPGADVVEELRRSLAELAEESQSREHESDRADQLAALGARLDQVSAQLGDLAEKVEHASAPSDDIAAELQTVRQRLDSFAAAPVDLDAIERRLAQLEGTHDEIAALRASIDTVAGSLDERRQSVDPVLEDVRGRVDELTSLREVASGLERRMDELAATVDRRGADDLRPELDDLRRRLEAVGSVGEVTADLERRIDELATSVDSARADDVRSELADVRRRLDDLGDVGELAARLTNTLDELASAVAAASSDDVMPRLDDLRRRVDELVQAPDRAAGLEERLAGVEGGMAAIDDVRQALAAATGDLSERRADLDARLDDVEERLAGAGALGETVAGLQRRVEELASRDDESRLGGFERALEELRAALDNRASTPVEPQVRALAEQLAHVGEQVERMASAPDAVERLDQRLAAAQADLRRRLDALAGEGASAADVVAIRTQIDALEDRLRAATDDSALTADVVELRDQVQSLAVQLRAAVQRGDDVVALRKAIDELAARVDATGDVRDLDERLGAIERRLANTAGLDAIRAELRSAAEASAAQNETFERSLMDRVHEMVGVTAPVVDELSTLSQRIDEVAARPVVDDGVRASIDELRQRLDAAVTAAADIAGLSQRLDALEGVQAEDYGQTISRLDAVEQAVGGVTDLVQELRGEQGAAGEQLAGLAEDLRARTTSDLESLRSEIESLRGRIDEREHSVRTRLDGLESRPSTDELRDRLDGLEGRLAQLVGRSELESAAGSLAGRLEELNGRVEELGRAVTDTRQAVVDDASSHVEERVRDVLHDLDEREQRLLERLGAQESDLTTLRAELEALRGAAGEGEEWRRGVRTELHETVDALGRRLAADASAATKRAEEHVISVGGVVDELVRRLDEHAAQTAADVEGTRIADAELAARIDDVALRLAEGTATAEGALRRELEELGGRVTAQEAAGRDEIERVTASIGWRLERIEESLAAGDAASLHETIEALERRLDAQAAQADEQVRVTEKALRKGLASLAEQLAGTESEYASAGDALRRSIERLGAAVSDADRRIAARETGGPARHEAATATEFVAFVPTDEGYRLVVVQGVAPEVGAEIELPEHPGTLVVTRIGASPLPLDARPCAYLGRVAD